MYWTLRFQNRLKIALSDARLPASQEQSSMKFDVSRSWDVCYYKTLLVSDNFATVTLPLYTRGHDVIPAHTMWPKFAVISRMHWPWDSETTELSAQQ
jgi:hypothetical protein